MSETAPLFTTGYLSRRFDVPQWQIDALFKRKLLPEPTRVGCYRVFAASDLPAIEAALIEAGYISSSTPEATPCPA